MTGYFAVYLSCFAACSSSVTEKPDFDTFRAALPYVDARAKIGLQLTDIEAHGFTRDVSRAQAYCDSWRPTSHVKWVEPARPRRLNNAALQRFRRGRVTGILVGLTVAFALVWLVVSAVQGAILRAQAEQVAADERTALMGQATDSVLGTGQDQAYMGITDWAGSEAALANGTAPIPKELPGHSPALDANHDGLACDPAAARHAGIIDNSSDYAVKIHRGRGGGTIQIEVVAGTRERFSTPHERSRGSPSCRTRGRGRAACSNVAPVPKCRTLGSAH